MAPLIKLYTERSFLVSESGIDGLELTKLWLSRSFERLSPENNTSTEGAAEANQATPATILNGAYMEILQWDDSHIFPEVHRVKLNSLPNG